MDNQNQKSQAFISRFLQNPALRESTPLQRERQIVQFLQQNTCDQDTTRKQLYGFLQKMLIRAEACREFLEGTVIVAISFVPVQTFSEDPAATAGWPWPVRRVLKIFRQIKYADSRMAQRHIAAITTIAVTGFIFAMLVGNFMGSAGILPGLNRHFEGRMDRVLSAVVGADATHDALLAAEYESLLLIMKQSGETLYTRHDNDYYRRFFGPADYQYLAAGDYGLFFDLRPLARQQSRETLIVFGAVILVVLVILTRYTPHFAITVRDPNSLQASGHVGAGVQSGGSAGGGVAVW